MMYTLSNKQEVFLIHLLDLQTKNVWNNGRKQRIRNIIKKQSYDEDDRDKLNKVCNEYKKYLKRGPRY